MFPFKNLFETISLHSNNLLNIDIIVEVRRSRMEREGFYTDNWMNWEHYAKVLKAKHHLLQEEAL